MSLAAPRVPPREVAAGCRLHAAAAARDAAALAPAPAAALPALRREYADAAHAALRALPRLTLVHAQSGGSRHGAGGGGRGRGAGARRPGPRDGLPRWDGASQTHLNSC